MDGCLLISQAYLFMMESEAETCYSNDWPFFLLLKGGRGGVKNTDIVALPEADRIVAIPFT